MKRTNAFVEQDRDGELRMTSLSELKGSKRVHPHSEPSPFERSLGTVVWKQVDRHRRRSLVSAPIDWKSVSVS